MSATVGIMGEGHGKVEILAPKWEYIQGKYFGINGNVK